jgi:uncharacterized protein YdhG (YjbR/CyaY superfamily)
MSGRVADAVMEYFQAQPEARRERLLALHQAIMTVYPRAQVDMAYRMPTYKVGDGWVALANQKQHISLYTCAYHHIEAFKQAHPGVKTGKGCINLRDRDELPMDDLIQVVRHAIKHPKPG